MPPLSRSAKRSPVAVQADPSLRERTRRAVQAELIETAERLFLRQGYEATSIDQIATAVGMSRRSFFRYFNSKEDLVLIQYERLGEEWVEALRSRPLNEPLWTSMRSIMDMVLDVFSDSAKARHTEMLNRITNESVALKAGVLERFDRVQDVLADVARSRAKAAGIVLASDDPAPRAIVGAAFACFMAVRDLAERKRLKGTLADAVDRAMSVVTVAPDAINSRRGRHKD